MCKKKIWVIVSVFLLSSCVTPNNKQIKSEINNTNQTNNQNNSIKPYIYNDNIKILLANIDLEPSINEKIIYSSIDDNGNIYLFSEYGQIRNIINFSEIKKYELHEGLGMINSAKLDKSGNGVITYFSPIADPYGKMQIKIVKLNNFKNTNKRDSQNDNNYLTLNADNLSIIPAYTDPINGLGSVIEINGADIIYSKIESFNQRTLTKADKLPNNLIFARSIILNEQNNGFLLGTKNKIENSTITEQYYLIKIIDGKISETGLQTSNFIKGNLDKDGNGFIITNNSDDSSTLYNISKYEFSNPIIINHKMYYDMATRVLINKEGDGFILEDQLYFQVKKYKADTKGISLSRGGMIGIHDLGEIKVNRFGDGLIYYNEYFRNEPLIPDSNGQLGKYKLLALPIKNYELQYK